MDQKIVTIVGGTGFLGRYVVKHLAAAGYTIRVIARHPDAGLHLKTSGGPGQIVLESGNLAYPESLQGKLDYSYAVINLVGILFEAKSALQLIAGFFNLDFTKGRKQNFIRLHAQGAEKLAQMARDVGAQRFIHVSALAVDKAQGSHYARSKLLGEKAVLAAFPEATILRPSVLFGAEDNFFNQFARLASFLPVMPVIGGHTRFQPVYAGDVAAAIEVCLAQPETEGKIFELGGPQVYTMREIIEYTLRAAHKKRPLINIPFPLATLKAAFLELLPRPLLTRDQVRLLKTDNVVSAHALTFANLGIAPTAVEMIVPEYLARFSKRATS
jgi:uncharacterized protein YbjT (DUF2867 family)